MLVSTPVAHVGFATVAAVHRGEQAMPTGAGGCYTVRPVLELRWSLPRALHAPMMSKPMPVAHNPKNSVIQALKAMETAVRSPVYCTAFTTVIDVLDFSRVC